MTEGRIFLKGKDITHARGKTLRDIYQDIQMVFQMPMESFDPRRTLGDGIGESLRNMGISRGKLVKEWKIFWKSAGWKRNLLTVILIRSAEVSARELRLQGLLQSDPEILICDEATSALDVTVQKQILEL